MRSRALGTQRLVGAALHDPEQRLVVAAVRGPRPRRPTLAVRSTASRMTSGGRRQRRAHVEHHLDVGAEQLLRGDGASPG